MLLERLPSGLDASPLQVALKPNPRLFFWISESKSNGSRGAKKLFQIARFSAYEGHASVVPKQKHISQFSDWKNLIPCTVQYTANHYEY